MNLPRLFIGALLTWFLVALIIFPWSARAHPFEEIDAATSCIESTPSMGRVWARNRLGWLGSEWWVEGNLACNIPYTRTRIEHEVRT